MRSKGVWLFPLLSFPEEAKVCSNLILLCLVLELDDRNLGPGGKWPNYAKVVNGDKLGVLGLKWEIVWNSLYLGFWSPGGRHCWDSMHCRSTWVFSGGVRGKRGVGGGANSTGQGQDCWWWCLWWTQQDQGVMNSQCCQLGIGTSVVIRSRA